MPDAQDHLTSTSYKRYFLLAACASFACMAGMRICDSLLPELALAFDADIGTAAGAISMFAIAYGLLQLVYGPLGDRYGKQRMILLAVSASAVTNLALAFAPDLPVLLGLRFVAGAFSAGIVPMSMAYVGDTVPYTHRQQELARLLTAAIMGMTFGQWSGGLLADTLGWRAAFALLALIFGSVAILMALSDRAAAPAAASVNRSDYAAKVKQVFSTPWARRVLIVTLIEGFFAQGAFAFIPAHINQHFGLTLAIAGAIVVLYGLGGMTYTLFARRILASIGERGMVICGSLLMSLGAVLLAFGPSWHWAMPACALSGFGFYCMHNTLQTNATQMAPQARGTAVSLFACALFLGQSAGVSAVALLFERYGSAVAFIPCAIVLPVLGLWMAWSIKHRRQANYYQAS